MQSLSSTWYPMVGLLLLLQVSRVYAECKPAPQKPNAVCGVRGYPPKNPYDYNLIANPVSVPTLSACQKLCNRRGDACGMYGYNTTSHICYLSIDVGRDGIMADKKSERIFYSMKCFDCPPPQCSSLDAITNFIDNGGFELDSKRIGPWTSASGDQFIPQPRQGVPRPPSANFTKFLRCSRTRFFVQNYRQCPNQTHKAEFDLWNVRKDHAWDLPRLDFGGFSYYPSGPTGNVPERISGFYTPGTPATIANLDCNSFSFAAQASIDNIVVRPVDLSASKIKSEEKIVNPGFETGSTDPWTYSSYNRYGPNNGSFKLVSPGIHGAYSLQFKGRAPEGTDIVIAPRLRNVTFSSGGDRLYRLGIVVTPSQHMTIDIPPFTQISASTNQYQYFYVPAKTTPTLSMALRIYGSTPVLFDNLSVLEITDTS